MNALPLRSRLLLLMPAAFVLGAIALVVALAYGRPIPLHDGPTFKLYVYDGNLVAVHITRGFYVGPGSETVDTGDGSGPRYVNFVAMNNWRMTLPGSQWSRVGLHVRSTPRVQFTDPTFTADRERLFGVHLAWLVGASVAMAAVAAVPYRRARRRQALLHASACPACGYDLRAHALNARCPECGVAGNRGLAG